MSDLDRLADDYNAMRRERDAQWADLERIASLCGRTADEHPLQAVARVVRERDALKARVARMMESISMACEEPRTGCECSGCSYARERGGDHE